MLIHRFKALLSGGKNPGDSVLIVANTVDNRFLKPDGHFPRLSVLGPGTVFIMF